MRVDGDTQTLQFPAVRSTPVRGHIDEHAPARPPILMGQRHEVVNERGDPEAEAPSVPDRAIDGDGWVLGIIAVKMRRFGEEQPFPRLGGDRLASIA